MKEEKSFDNLKGSFEVAVLCDKHLTIGINRLTPIHILLSVSQNLPPQLNIKRLATHS
jgi:hypothetical protein